MEEMFVEIASEYRVGQVQQGLHYERMSGKWR